MIAKITKGKSPQAIGRYLHGPGHANEHHYSEDAYGVVIGGSMAKEGDRDAARWARQMQRLVDKRPDIDKPILQVSLSAADSDVAQGKVRTDAQWEKISREYMRDMGLEHHPWVVVRHDPAHVHIVASRINGDGRVWNMHQDHRRSQRATRAIEERHDLERVPSRSNGRPAPTQAPELVHPAERALKERGVPSWRAQIKAVVDDVMSVAVTPKQFEEALAKRGVGIYSNKQGDAVYTIDTKNGQRKITGHKLGADYQEGRITNGLERRQTTSNPTATADQNAAYLGAGRRELAALRAAERAEKARRLREQERAAAKAAEREKQRNLGFSNWGAPEPSRGHTHGLTL